jgi:multidrug efflux system outer membrane protein
MAARAAIRHRRRPWGVSPMAALAPTLIAAGVLAGCAARGPEHVRPSVPMPAAYSVAASAPGAAPGAVPAAEHPPVAGPEVLDTAWWMAFGDTRLDALVREALANNQDLKVAAARIEQFAAALQVSRADELPQVTAGAGATREALSQNRQVPLAPGVRPIGSAYQVFASAGWELDLWGRIARGSEAARADLLASEESRRALALTLVAEVATAYVRLLGLDTELAARRSEVASWRDTLDLQRKRFEGGGASELPALAAQVEVEQAEAAIPAIEQKRALLEHALADLLGRPPGSIPRAAGGLEAIRLPVVPSGLPSDLLLRRPDVRRAEQELAAATARIGVAKAQYLPTVSLTAQQGFASADLSNLLRLSSNFASFGPLVVGTLFDAGRSDGAVKEREAAARAQLALYQRTVQVALKDVEDALAVHRVLGQEAELRARQVRALDTLRGATQRRFDGGVSPLLDVLEAERALLAGRLQAAVTQRDRHVALIGLYRAMGGGWSLPELDPANSLLATADADEAGAVGALRRAARLGREPGAGAGPETQVSPR